MSIQASTLVKLAEEVIIIEAPVEFLINSFEEVIPVEFSINSFEEAAVELSNPIIELEQFDVMPEVISVL